jgi:Helix-turn-helix.
VISLDKTIGSRLKQYREDSGFSVEEVCQKLNTLGYKLSPKTLYGYENDVSSPKISVFVNLCNIYGVSDISGSFGYTVSVPPPVLRLTPPERSLILAYRRADTGTKAAVEKLLDLNTASAQSKEA